MATHASVSAHKTWEDWTGLGLGVLIILSPSLARETGDPTVILTSSIIGILVAILAALELVQLGRWEEVLETLSGLALIAAPFVLGYAGEGVLQWWHIVLGAAVALLGLTELWQDRRLKSEELLKSRD